MKFCIVLLFLATFYSCKKKEGEFDLHYDYFPIEKGYFVEYEVTSIIHDDLSNIHDTAKYKLKTVIGDTIIDEQGRIVNKFYRYIYDTIYQKYKQNDLWTILLDNGRGELVEENQRKIKIILPPTKTKEWDLNAFNNNKEVLLYFSNIHKPYKVNNNTFQSTVTVEEDSVYNLIEYKRKFEVYAKGVGLVKKHYQDFEISNFDYTSPIKGHEYFYEVISYGKQ